MPNINDEIIVDKVINTIELPNLNESGFNGDAIRSAYTLGSRIYNIADNFIYTVVEDSDGYKFEKGTNIILPGTYIRVKSLDNDLYRVNNEGMSLVTKPSPNTEESGSKKKSPNSLKKFPNSLAFKYLEKFAPKTLDIIKQNNILSSFELLLPIILDNVKYFIGNEIGAKLAPERYKIVEWLEKNNFITKDKNGSYLLTDKEITSADIRNFAVMICHDIYEIKSLNQGSVDFTFLNSRFFNKDFDIENNGEIQTINIKKVLSDLRSSGYLYSSDKDVAIRNLLNGSFRNKEGKPKVQLVNNKPISESDIFTRYITDYYKKIINFNELKESFKSINLSEDDKAYLNSNLNAQELYEFLKKVNDTYSLSNDLKNKVDYIISNCNPYSLILLLIDVQSEIRNKINTDPTLYKNNIKYVKDEINAIRNNLILKVHPFLEKFNSILDNFDVKLNFDPFTYLENPEYRSEASYSTGKQYELPKNINPIDPEAPKQFLNPKFLEDSNIESYVSDPSVTDTQLQSASANLNNPKVEKELVKYFSSIIFLDLLKEQYDIPLDDEDFDFTTVLQQVNKKINPYAKPQFVTIFPIFHGLKLYFKELYNILKPEIEKIKEQLEQLIKGNTYTNTQVNTEYLYNDVRTLISVLDKYMKSNNYDIFSLNYDDLVNTVESNLSLAQQFYSKPLFSGYYFTSIDTILEKINDFLPAFNIALNDNVKNKVNNDISEIESKAHEVVQNIRNAVADEITRRQTKNEYVTDISSHEDARELLGYYSNFEKLLRRAAKVFTIEDFNLMLSRLKESNNTVNNSIESDLNEESVELYNTAMTIINLFGLTSKSDYPDVNKVLHEVINSSKKYSTLYSRIINMNVVNNNISILCPLIIKILRSEKTYDYDTIKNDIMNSKETIYLTTEITDDDNTISPSFKELDKQFIEVFKDAGITTFDTLNTTDKLDIVLNSIPNTDSISLWIYLANKLYYLYYNLNKDNSYLKNYLSANKFNLVLDVANSLTKTGKAITDRVLSAVTSNMGKLQYFFDARNVVNRLDKDRYYRYLPGNVKNAYANNEVLEAIEVRLYKHISSDSRFNLLLQDCTNIDFNDYIVGNMLQYCKVIDIDGDIISYDDSSKSFNAYKYDTSGQKSLNPNKRNLNLRRVLDDTRLNSAEPRESNYLPDYSDVFTKLFNKLKGSNAVGVTQNAVVILGVLKELTKRQDYLTTIAGNIQGSIIPNLQDRISKLKDKKISNKILDKLNIVLDSYTKSLGNLDSNFKELRNIAKEQINQIIPKLLDYLAYWKSNNPEIASYVDIVPLSNKERKSPFAKDTDKIFPVHIEVNYAKVRKDWADYVNKKFLNGNEINQLKTKLDILDDMVMQNFNNALAVKSFSVNDTVKLQQLLKNIKLLKLEFNKNIASKLLNGISNVNLSEAKTDVPSPEYVENKVNSLNSIIDLKLDEMVHKSIKSEEYVDSIMKECSTLDDEYKKIILISNAVSDIESGNKRAIVDILHL